MASCEPIDLDRLCKHMVRLRANPGLPPDASVIVPVNTQGDLENVLQLLTDIISYNGKYSLEVILVINNYPPQKPPPEIQTYARLGLKVVSIPNVRRPGEAVGFTARIHGVQAASSENTILFDADCRIPNPSALIDWYIDQFKAGAQVAYTHVGFYGLRARWSIRTRILIHHLARWVKRNVFCIPTTRGSNYAVNRSIMLHLYNKGMLADEMNVGPNVKAVGGRVEYSCSKELMVLTSGRMLFGSWARLLSYFMYRLRYNIRTLPVRPNVSRYTKREKDPIRRYVNNRPER